jgi:hypothetical protein
MKKKPLISLIMDIVQSIVGIVFIFSLPVIIILIVLSVSITNNYKTIEVMPLGFKEVKKNITTNTTYIKNIKVYSNRAGGTINFKVFLNGDISNEQEATYVIMKLYDYISSNEFYNNAIVKLDNYARHLEVDFVNPSNKNGYVFQYYTSWHNRYRRWSFYKGDNYKEYDDSFTLPSDFKEFTQGIMSKYPKITNIAMYNGLPHYYSKKITIYVKFDKVLGVDYFQHHIVVYKDGKMDERSFFETVEDEIQTSIKPLKEYVQSDEFLDYLDRNNSSELDDDFSVMIIVYCDHESSPGSIAYVAYGRDGFSKWVSCD